MIDREQDYFDWLDEARTCAEEMQEDDLAEDEARAIEEQK